MNFSLITSFLAIWVLVASSQISEANGAACTPGCGDYHRVCIGVKDPTALAKFKADSQSAEVTQVLKYKEFPQPDCGNILYKLLCPHSCGECTPCMEEKLGDLTQTVNEHNLEISQLKKELFDLEEEIAEVKKSAEANTPAAVVDEKTDVKLALTAHSSSAIYNANYPLSALLDNNGKSCFISKLNGGGWAKLRVPESYIQTVKVQNRWNCCGDRMTGNAVYVCIDEDEASCSKCGEFAKVDTNAWGTMTCNRRGRIIKLTAPTSYLQVTEVEAYGRGIGSTEEYPELDLTGHSSAEIYADAYSFPNLLDNNENTCYISKDSAGGWVKLSMSESYVTSVHVQNRPDCCGERMAGNIVYLCLDDTDASCTSCGVFGSVATKASGVIKCNKRGKFIKIVAPNSYLQITQVKAYGEKLLDPVPARIPITADSSYQIYSNTYTLAKSIDDNEGTLYISKTDAGGWAKYKIPESYVSSVRVQNRPDCCGNRMTGNIVYVCFDETEASCSSCGALGNIPTKGWGELSCDVRGSFIKIVAPSSYLQLAQVDPIGTVLKNPPVMMVPINADSSSPVYGAAYTLENSLDDNEATCFITQAAAGGWVKYQVPESYVSVVRVQNRPDCCGERMTGNEVYACLDASDESCSKCGAFGNVPTKGWGVVTCKKRAVFIKIVAPASYLQITQVEVHGQELSEPPPLPLAITFDSSSPIYSNGWKTEYALDNKGNTGFITRANKGGWIKFKFPLSYVSKVRVQNRHNCCGERMTGNKVYVCADNTDATCKECGAFGVVATNAWGEMNCNKKGTVIKIEAPASYLQITQADAYGVIQTDELHELNLNMNYKI